jgi:conjugal transfer pilus assembly protein TraE
MIIVTAFLFSKSERVVVVPAVIEREFWIDRNAVSQTYLEQFGVFLGQQVLGKTPQSAPSQRTLVLRHTDPNYYGALRKKLIEEEEMLVKQNISYSFFPVDVSADPEKLTVTLIGDRLSFVGGSQVQSQRERFTLGFVYTGARLLLNSLVEGSSQ